MSFVLLDNLSMLRLGNWLVTWFYNRKIFKYVFLVIVTFYMGIQSVRAEIDLLPASDLLMSKIPELEFSEIVTQPFELELPQFPSSTEVKVFAPDGGFMCGFVPRDLEEKVSVENPVFRIVGYYEKWIPINGKPKIYYLLSIN